ncbi:MAG: outer membrane protein assembly factor BamE [Omnitrophica bacterium]|nr:outer membrane protein assembly factor BamE [Candidatus Omnitrophota bacterium]
MNAFKLSLVLSLLFLCGCADITPPTPGYILKRPLGTDSVKTGMTKDEVKSLWGGPDRVNQVENKDKWEGKREEWVYVGRYGTLPVNAGYLSKTKKLYFDGERLTTIVEE